MYLLIQYLVLSWLVVPINNMSVQVRPILRPMPWSTNIHHVINVIHKGSLPKVDCNLLTRLL